MQNLKQCWGASASTHVEQAVRGWVLEKREPNEGSPLKAGVEAGSGPQLTEAKQEGHVSLPSRGVTLVRLRGLETGSQKLERRNLHQETTPGTCTGLLDSIAKNLVVYVSGETSTGKETPDICKRNCHQSWPSAGDTWLHPSIATTSLTTWGIGKNSRRVTPAQ